MYSEVMAEDEEELVLHNWYKKRKKTAIVGIILKCLFSFECSSISISALYYFKYTFKIPEAKQFFSLAMGMMYLTASVAAFFTGRYMDRTRNLRQIVNVLLVLSIVGNVLYTLPFSKWLPIIGRGLCGLADGIQPAISGEFSRCYPRKELGKILTIYHILGALMYAIAPSSPVLFQFINFRIGSVILNQYNFIGIFQASATLLVLIMSYFGITDLSKDPGYHLYVNKVKTVKSDHMTEDKIVKEDKSDSYWTLKDILKDNILAIIIPGAALLQFLSCQIEIIVNLTALYNFEWSMNKLGILAFFTSSAISTCILVLNSKFLKSAEMYYYLFTLTLLAAMTAFSLLMFSINGDVFAYDTMNMMLYFAIVALFFFFSFGSMVYGKWILFSLAPAHSRCYVDSVRFITVKVFSCIGFLTAAYAYSENEITLPIFAIISFVYAVLLLIRRNIFFSRL